MNTRPGFHELIRLVDVYAQQPDNSASTRFLYELLAERDPTVNISHRKMPTFEQHRDFVESRPYKAWYVVFHDDHPIGATYLTEQNEIGIFICKVHQGRGYGKLAILALMNLHPEKRYLANIAPGNSRSMAMFERLGFGLIQLTFERFAE